MRSVPFRQRGRQMASQLALPLPLPSTAPWPGESSFSPGTQCCGGSRLLAGPGKGWLIPAGRSKTQGQRLPRLHLGAPRCPAASAPSPCAPPPPTQPQALTPCWPLRTFPWGTKANPCWQPPQPCSGLQRPDPEHPRIPQRRQPGRQSCGSFGDTHTPPHVPGSLLLGTETSEDFR